MLTQAAYWCIGTEFIMLIYLICLYYLKIDFFCVGFLTQNGTNKQPKRDRASKCNWNVNVNENGLCRKCNNVPKDSTPSFNVMIYVQNEADPEDIVDLFAFKSSLDCIASYNGINEDILNQELSAKICEAEYSQSKMVTS